MIGASRPIGMLPCPDASSAPLAARLPLAPLAAKAAKSHSADARFQFFAPFAPYRISSIPSADGATFNDRPKNTMATNNPDATYLDRCRKQLEAEQAQSLAETDGWAHVDKPAIHAEWDALYRELSAKMESLSPGDQEAQAFIRRHFEIARKFYPPSKEAYIGMGLFYNDNEAMRDFHNSYHPRMVEFLGEAIAIFARNNLQSA